MVSSKDHGRPVTHIMESVGATTPTTPVTLPTPCTASSSSFHQGSDITVGDAGLMKDAHWHIPMAGQQKTLWDWFSCVFICAGKHDMVSFCPCGKM